MYTLVCWGKTLVKIRSAGEAIRVYFHIHTSQKSDPRSGFVPVGGFR